MIISHPLTCFSICTSRWITEDGKVEFSLRWGVAVHTRKEQVWISYDPNGNKVECPLRSNRDTRMFKNVRHLHSEKETERCGSPYNIRAMYEIKENKKVCSNERTLFDSHTKLSRAVPLGNWRICVAVHLEKEGKIHPEEGK